MFNIRRPLIVGNWKMNGLKKDAKKLASNFAEQMINIKNSKIDIVVCPSSPLLGLVSDALNGSGIKVGSQDNSHAKSGAHTGEISPLLLKNVGCSYAIVGHSERRTSHGEDNKIVKAKAGAAIDAGMIAIICIGETLKERRAGRAISANRNQLLGSLPQNTSAKNTVIAYEPIWAIGTGEVATPAQVQEVHILIRAELVKEIGAIEAARTRILYGGSIKSNNVEELITLPDVDGGLIGGASLVASEFWAIVESAI